MIALKKDKRKSENLKRRSMDGIAIPCSFCGSVEILSGRFRKYFEQGRNGLSFCDRQCRAGWTSQNLHLSNFSQVLKRNKEQRLALLHKHQESQFLIAGGLSPSRKFTCCPVCDIAFDSTHGGVTCGDRCRVSLRSIRKRAIKPVQVKCKYCNELRWEGFASKAKKPFCSSRCDRKASKDKRVNWARCNGRCEYISLCRLIKRDGIKCKACGCDTTRYNGSYSATDASVDHVVALANGGTHTWDNVQVMCILCNSIKSDNHTGGIDFLKNDSLDDTMGQSCLARQNPEVKTESCDFAGAERF